MKKAGKGKNCAIFLIVKNNNTDALTGIFRSSGTNPSRRPRELEKCKCKTAVEGGAVKTGGERSASDARARLTCPTVHEHAAGYRCRAHVSHAACAYAPRAKYEFTMRACACARRGAEARVRALQRRTRGSVQRRSGTTMAAPFPDRGDRRAARSTSATQRNLRENCRERDATGTYPPKSAFPLFFTWAILFLPELLARRFPASDFLLETPLVSISFDFALEATCSSPTSK